MPTTQLPLWAMVLMIGMPAISMLLSAALWWHGIRTVATYHQETSKTLSDITAIAQAIAAQTRELLRRTEP
jgi:hypothetical protein